MRLSHLCAFLNEQGFEVRLEGDDVEVRGVNTLEEASTGELTFLSNVKYLRMLTQTRASAVMVPNDVEVPKGISAIRCRDPYVAVTLAIIKLHGHRKHPQWGVSAGSVIHPTAKIGLRANIAPGATVAAQASLGNDCTLYPGCYVGDGAKLGDGCTLFPNVVVYDGCELGHRVTIHAGSVIGEDGLGYAPHQGRWVKIPQVGKAIIGDDVEIGANCTIDRATLGCTEIGAGTKFGNVVVIGHGTKVGSDCMFVGLVGIAGSVKVGNRVTLAGQVGVAGHISIGDETRIAAQSGIMADTEPKSNLLGSPAVPLDEAKRSILWIRRLPELSQRIKDLERQLAELRAELHAQSRADQVR